MDLLTLFEHCRMCPRDCGVNRLKEGKTGRKGFCGESHELRVAYVGPHFGEEPPISGERGSGTIFFTGCSLKCTYCQNVQISRGGLGTGMDGPGLFKAVVDMIRKDHVHNINFVTPDHFFPHVFDLISRLRRAGFELPMVFNLSGYQSAAMLRMTEDYADIYLPDFKYADPNLAFRYSRCRDYPAVALKAITEMVGQKDFVDIPGQGSSITKKGVIVRHLILPGHVKNSLDALTGLFLEFGARLPLSLMSQYHPLVDQGAGSMNRPITPEEFDRVYSHALDLGFEHLYVQFPDEEIKEPPAPSPFLPDFTRASPFI